MTEFLSTPQAVIGAVLIILGAVTAAVMAKRAKKRRKPDATQTGGTGA